MTARRWAVAYWLAGGLSLLAIRLTQWGPQPTSNGQFLLHLAGTTVEIALVMLLLGGRRRPLAYQLAALLITSLAALLWARQATPSGSGANVAHVIWLMLLVVILAGSLGWDLFNRVLDRRRPL